jgi:asparagine synthase (glutamine-hydrolysing)
MCGITGFWDRSTTTGDDKLRATVAQMTERLHHRGPDDTGTWCDSSCGLALGHKRLSIIDLSPMGHQPMNSACGRYWLVYNGEIYNHAELRRELGDGGYPFRGRSDTEVLLAGLALWGIEHTIRRCVGMFALAVWDGESRRLTLARDRLGIKPLFYGWQGESFLFGSELKALSAHPAFTGEVDRKSLSLYVQHSYVPAPYSIYKNVYKLPAGTLLSVGENSASQEVAPRPYWCMKEIAQRGAAEPFVGSTQEAVTQLDQVLGEAVRSRMEADVPLGAFLSGGIDSSTIVALMQAASTERVKTFSIGFDEPGYNEAVYAKEVAAHLGTEHTEQYVTPADALEVIPRLPTLYDEPFADSSQIPTFLVSQMARQHVTVCLSGDGGDELFAGYNRYAYMQQLWRKIGWCPAAIRSAAASVLSAIVPAERGGTLTRKARTLAGFLSLTDAPAMYARMHTHWKDPAELIIGGALPVTTFSQTDIWACRESFLEKMLYVDSVTYLPDDILVKVDRASMAVGLEARVPMIDHRVVEFAWSLPVELKVRNGESKWLLRQLLDRYVPRPLIERPKVGFGVPIDTWLRGSLRDWAEALLDERRLNDEGFFQPQPIRQKWQEHLSGKRDWHYYLWDILMFQAWLTETRADCS